MGGAVAEWPKALLQCVEKINENHEIPGSPPGFARAPLKIDPVLIEDC